MGFQLFRGPHSGYLHSACAFMVCSLSVVEMARLSPWAGSVLCTLLPAGSSSLSSAFCCFHYSLFVFCVRSGSWFLV